MFSRNYMESDQQVQIFNHTMLKGLEFVSKRCFMSKIVYLSGIFEVDKKDKMIRHFDMKRGNFLVTLPFCDKWL